MVQKLTKKWVANSLPKRPKDANKGTFGKVLVVAGSKNYPGAAYLACAAAYRVGAGLVTLVTTKVVQEIVSRKLPEVTFVILPQEISFKGIDVCLIGPGLGQNKDSAKLMGQLINAHLSPTVIDGDGLNLLSHMGEWWEKIEGEIVLTPHPGEMSRLTTLSIGEIQSDRENITKKFATKWGTVVVLKGANTVIASPTGEVALSTFANPALATAGTGDILSGAVAGFLAQGLKTFEAACVGTYIHGFAGEMLKEKLGDAGIIASDLLPLLPKTIKKIKEL